MFLPDPVCAIAEMARQPVDTNLMVGDALLVVGLTFTVPGVPMLNPIQNIAINLPCSVHLQVVRSNARLPVFFTMHVTHTETHRTLSSLLKVNLDEPRTDIWQV